MSKRKTKDSGTDNIKRRKGPEKVTKTKTKLTEEEKRERDSARVNKNLKKAMADPVNYLQYCDNNNYSRRINRHAQKFADKNALTAKDVLKQYKEGNLIFHDVKGRRGFEVPNDMLKRPETIDKSTKKDDEKSNLNKKKTSRSDDDKFDDNESSIMKNDDESKVNSVDLSDKIISTMEKYGRRFTTLLFDDDELRNLSKFKNNIFKPENKQVAKLK